MSGPTRPIALESAFAHYRTALPLDASVAEIAAQRQAFYAGATFMAVALRYIVAPPEAKGFCEQMIAEAEETMSALIQAARFP